MPKKSRCTPEEFVTAWETSATAEQAAAKLGLTVNAVRSRAQHYRKQGVPLKTFRRGTRPLDVEGLTALVERLRSGGPTIEREGPSEARKRPKRAQTATK